MDEMVEAIRVLGEGSLAGDRALLELVQAVIEKINELEKQVHMLMELHRLDEEK
jgi:hypothetical protein